MRLIDWEYAAMGESDVRLLGNFVAQGSAGYTVEETLGILPAVLRPRSHVAGAAASLLGCGFCSGMVLVRVGYVQRGHGRSRGRVLYIWYRAAKQFAAAAEKLYGEAERS